LVLRGDRIFLCRTPAPASTDPLSPRLLPQLPLQELTPEAEVIKKSQQVLSWSKGQVMAFRRSLEQIESVRRSEEQLERFRRSREQIEAVRNSEEHAGTGIQEERRTG
jgi:hypothetical protein